MHQRVQDQTVESRRPAHARLPHPRGVPAGVYAEQAIGISTDEFHRAKDADVAYLRNVFPLIELDWTRTDCQNYLTKHGMANTPKSACTGCPFHSNTAWRHLRDTDPSGWAEALAFDTAIRHGHPRATQAGHHLRGRYYLHRSCQPLSHAPLEPRPQTRSQPREPQPEPPGCSPWSCPGEHPPTPPPAAPQHRPTP